MRASVDVCVCVHMHVLKEIMKMEMKVKTGRNLKVERVIEYGTHENRESSLKKAGEGRWECGR